MIKRLILSDLHEWKEKRNRKPLVIRGARQVGKTTLVKEFAREFDAFVMLNQDLRCRQHPCEDNGNPASYQARWNG